MPLRLIREPLGADSVTELAETLGDRVRLAVDVARGVVAAGACAWHTVQVSARPGLL